MAIATGQIILAADVNAIKHTSVYYVSDTLRNSNDAEKTTASNAYVKLKEVLLNADLSYCRLKFDGGRAGDGTYWYLRIYKNGVAIGTEQTIAQAPTTYSEDFSGFVSGNLIQIYGRTDSTVLLVNNMRFYYDKRITHIGGEDLTTDLLLTISAISMTNQDP